MKPKNISVCIATFNGQNYITKQLESIRNQSCQPDEVVICDDGSTDETVNMIRAFIQTHHLEESWHLYCNEQNKGYPENFYYSMSLCTGDIVFLADQDDIWEPDKIKKMQYIMSGDEDIKLLSSAWGIVDSAGTVIRKPSVPGDYKSKITVPQIFYKYEWPGMSMCYRRELGLAVIKKAGRSKVPHDMALALTAAEQNGFVTISQCLQYHRHHGANVAMEEHRLMKILNKKRKMIEIDRYLKMLDAIAQSQVLEQEDNRKLVQCKMQILKKRLHNLTHGKLFGIIGQYLQNRDMVRASTLICDCLICWQRGKE